MTGKEIQSLGNLYTYIQSLIDKRLWLKVLVSIALGVLTGIVLSSEFLGIDNKILHQITAWLGIPGQIFLRLVKMIMIPLILASIIRGIISNSLEQLKKLGFGVLFFFVATTSVSIVIGTVLTTIFSPGKYMSLGDVNPAEESLSAKNKSNIPEMIVNLLPENPLASMVTGEMLSIVIFAIISGIALLMLSKKTAEPVVKLLSAVQEISMVIVGWAMKLVPYAVFGMVAQLIANVGIESLTGIGYYMLVVLLGLLCLILMYIVIIQFFGGGRIGHFFSSIRDVQLLAFSTASSAAVMPLSLKTAEEKLKIPAKLTNFIIPIGATINMNGTAIYQCISTIFIAQAYGVELGLATLVLVNITIVLASIGTPSIPGGGVIVMASILQSAGIPSEGVILIIGVDRILGMFRTAVNVTGDLTACVFFNHLLKTSTNQDSSSNLSQAEK